MRDFGDTEVWAKPMSDGSAVVLFHRGTSAAAVSTSAAEVGLGGSSSYSFKDLWSKTTSTTSGTISASVAPHGVAMYRVTRVGTLAAPPASGTYQVSDISWLTSSNGWGPVERNMSNGEQAAGDGGTLSIVGSTYPSGIGAHADSAVHVYLGRACRIFTAKVRIDGEVGSNGSVRFQVYGDGRLLGYTDVKTGSQAATTMTVSTGGYLALDLRATDARESINYDHPDWAAARFVC